MRIIEKILLLILHLMAGFLSPGQIQDVERRHRSEKKEQPSDKIKAILLLDRGFSHSEVASILLIDMTTVRRWHQIYTEKGICAFVRKTFKVKYTTKGMTSLLHNLGYTYKKPKHIPMDKVIHHPGIFLRHVDARMTQHL